jgi:hypothetical protein
MRKNMLPFVPRLNDEDWKVIAYSLFEFLKNAGRAFRGARSMLFGPTGGTPDAHGKNNGGWPLR